MKLVIYLLLIFYCKVNHIIQYSLKYLSIILNSSIKNQNYQPRPFLIRFKHHPIISQTSKIHSTHLTNTHFRYNVVMRSNPIIKILK
jgi:hypothetical protein